MTYEHSPHPHHRHRASGASCRRPGCRCSLPLGVATCGDDDDSDDDTADDTAVEQPADDDADEVDDTDHFDAEGNAEVELDVKATSEDGSMDCTTDSCVVKLFGAHQSGFGDVAELPVSFAN